MSDGSVAGLVIGLLALLIILLVLVVLLVRRRRENSRLQPPKAVPRNIFTELESDVVRVSVFVSVLVRSLHCRLLFLTPC